MLFNSFAYLLFLPIVFQDDRTDDDASKRAGHQAVAGAATRVAA